MRHREPTCRNLISFAAVLAVVSMALSAGIGCAGGGGAAKNETAIHSYVQGVMAYQMGENDKAMASFKEAVAKKDDLVMARSMLGDLYRARSEYDSAREQYEVLTHVDPYDYFNHYRLGLSYQLLERLPDAAGSYLKALNLKPTDSQSNMSLGTVYFSLGRPQDAVQYAIKATELDPRSAAAFVNLGLILDAVRDYPRAAQAYRKSLDLDSSQPLVQLYLAENLLQQKLYGEARSVMAGLIRVQDTPLNRKRYGDAYAGEKAYSDAITQYQTALKMDPNYYPALNEIGATYIEDYKKGLELDDAKRKAALEAWQQSLAIKREQPRITALFQQYSKAPLFQP